MPDISYRTPAIKALVEDPETDGLALYLLALKTAGGWEALHGDAEEDILEIFHRIENATGGKLPVENETKLNAMRSLVESDAFFERPAVFDATCTALTQGDIGVDDGLVDTAEWAEILWALFTAATVRGEDEEAEFSKPVTSKILRALGELSQEKDPMEQASAFMTEMKSRMRSDLMTLGLPEEDITKLFLDAEGKNSFAPAQPAPG